MKKLALIAAALAATPAVALAQVGTPNFVPVDAAPAAVSTPAVAAWTSFVTADQVAQALGQKGVVILDARSPEEYAAGHIPGAINLPGDDWRTPGTDPGQGDSQYIFRDESGEPDVARYERLLSGAGIKPTDTVIVYGNHAGKGDGSVPAMILDWLGHDRVAFLDGVGMTDWQAAGRDVEQATNVLPAGTYAADPRPDVIWDLDDVLTNLRDDRVVFLDTRSKEEFAGDLATLEKRGNARGGRIPGAVLLDYGDQLDAGKHVLPPEKVATQLAERGVDKDKAVVLYCQTATRVSLPYLALKDLGFTNVKVYDASWHEYGNRPDTPIEGETANPARALSANYDK